jgi:transposase InsO family protein
MKTTGINGERYFMTFTDGATKFKRVVFLKTKDEAEHQVMNYIEFIQTQHGKRCKAFRFDLGGEYYSANFRGKLAEKGIIIEPTAGYSPQQNGVSERLNRTIQDRARAMLIAQDLPTFLWPAAVAYAIYIINRSPTRSLLTHITPYEAFWQRKPDVSNMHEFGIKCWVLTQAQIKAKFEP